MIRFLCLSIVNSKKRQRSMKKEIPWELIISDLKQDISDADKKHLEEWVSIDENRKVYEELRGVWEKVRAKVINYTPDVDFYWKELMQRMEECEEAERRQAEDMERSEDKVEVNLKDKEQPVRLWAFPRFQRYVAAACVVVAVFLSVSLYIGIKIGQPEMAQQTYSNWGGKSEVALPDGSNVWIHSATSLTYNTNYYSKNRNVRLNGEAYFDVAHDKDHPFVVETEGMKITVHGTKFNVESFPGSENTFVSLKEGSVSLETKAETRFLHPGEVGTFNKRNGRLQIEKGDIELAVSWASNQIVFKNRPLNEICPLLSKWYNVKINLSPELQEQYRYTFTLRHEPLEEIMRIMSRIHPINYEFNDENMLTILPKQKQLK